MIEGAGRDPSEFCCYLEQDLAPDRTRALEYVLKGCYYFYTSVGAKTLERPAKQS